MAGREFGGSGVQGSGVQGSEVQRFRGSEVQGSASPLAAEAASLIIKKPCHFGVVSYEGLTKK